MGMFVQKILVRTDDFQLAYRIMHMLRTRNIDVEQRSLSEALPTKDTIWRLGWAILWERHVVNNPDPWSPFLARALAKRDRNRPW